MLLLNLQNVEGLIFSDEKIRSLLPELRPAFDQWLLSKRVPALRSLRLRSLMDVLNGLTGDQVIVLEEYFGDNIALDRLDYHVTKNVTLPLDFNSDKELADCVSYSNFAISRDEGRLYISFWR